MKNIYKNLFPKIRFTSVIITLVLLTPSFASCNLFDKELRQDQHIADFRHQMNRVTDSLDNAEDKIEAYLQMQKRIIEDGDLITLRKKNILLAESNAYISNEYFSQEKYEKALEYNDAAINLNSKNSCGYYNRGRIYQALGKDTLALENYTKAISINVEYADAYYNRGIIYELQDECEKAIEDYTNAIKLKPTYLADIYNNRGNTYLEMNMLDEAIEDYGRVISLDSTYVKAYSNRATAYLKKDNLEQALEDYNTAIHIDSTSANLYYHRATIYSLKKAYKEALDDYEKVMHLDSGGKMKDEAKTAMKKITPLLKKS